MAKTSRREGTPHDEAAALALTMRRDDFRDLTWLADSGFHDMLRFLFTAVRRTPLRSESRRQARNGGGHGCQSGPHRRSALFRSQALGANDLDVLNADKGEHCAQISLLEVVRLKRHSRRVETA